MDDEFYPIEPVDTVHIGGYNYPTDHTQPRESTLEVGRWGYRY